MPLSHTPLVRAGAACVCATGAILINDNDGWVGDVGVFMLVALAVAFGVDEAVVRMRNAIRRSSDPDVPKQQTTR